MYVICIESSNIRGMGHLFRSLLYVEYFKQHGIDFILLINNDAPSLEVLKRNNIEYILVDFSDTISNWEEKIIRQNHVTVWINDKFKTSLALGKHVTETGCVFCLIDDMGEAEKVADIHFAGMIYPTKKDIKGKKVYCGSEYIILNPQIAEYKRIRHYLNKLIVSLGGSDPYGVTVEVAKELLNYDYDVDIIIGPNFKYRKDLDNTLHGKYNVYQNVPSLIEKFFEYDFAITGGGVTCCEANAAGLPCMIIANAEHEKNTGHYVSSLGGSVYAGDFTNWNKQLLKELPCYDLQCMSRCGMKAFRLDTVERIINTISNYERERSTL